MRKRVLIDCRNLSYPGSGLCSYVEGILSCLGDYVDCIDFIFLVEDKKSIDRLKLNYEYKTIISGCKKSNMLLRDFFEQVVFPIIFIFLRIDVFHGVDYYIPFLPTSYKKITTIHDCAVFHEFEGRSKLVKAYCRLLQKLSAKCSDCIIAITEYGKNEILKFHQVDSNKIAVILNGINEDFYKSVDKVVEQEVSNKLRELGKYILYYGGYRNHKNVQTLLSAFSLSNRRDLKLVLVGPPKAVQDILMEFNNYSENYYEWGFATNEELKCLLDHCEAFIFPSCYEGFGLPIAEAMARNSRTICRNIKVTREVGGDSVYYFDDIDGLTGYIKRVEELPKILQLKTYHWKDSISKYIKLYKNI